MAQVAGSGTAAVDAKVRLSAKTELPLIAGARAPNLAYEMPATLTLRVCITESALSMSKLDEPKRLLLTPKTSRKSVSASELKSPRSTETEFVKTSNVARNSARGDPSASSPFVPFGVPVTEICCPAAVIVTPGALMVVPLLAVSKSTTVAFADVAVSNAAAAMAIMVFILCPIYLPRVMKVYNIKTSFRQQS